ncbi:MAG: indolepyruvate ferredoxin oxidoreductase subunit alpha [Eubacteriales bacterium]
MEFLMGNEAIALGAIQAGVGFVSGYPGTPSTEILETVAKHNDGSVYVEWSVNEKAAMEVAAGASYSGVRTLVTMKQVGLNVASDPLMCLAYIGVKGGMVIVVADDPGPISSQTEQDSRHFAQYSKLPVFDPSSPEEAYEMIGDAFAYSEEYGTPVLFRPTTRVCHGCTSIELKEKVDLPKPEGFIKDSKWVIFPRLANMNHVKIEARNVELEDVFSSYRFNTFTTSDKHTRKAVATGGVSYEYVREALSIMDTDCKLLKIGTPHPFPATLALEMLKDVDEVFVVEELDPVIERELIYLCGKHNIKVSIKGKLTGDIANAGENTVESVRVCLSKYLDVTCETGMEMPQAPALPIRPPVLCAGCPHRASFYAVKQAMKGRKAIFTGDIGCYTLGNAAPLDMVDTCLCMGAGITMAQGLHKVAPDTVHFSFVGDSTFFASGITGVVNAVYNEHNMVVVILDNSTTAMTGHQPHPGTGKTMMGSIAEKISIKAVLEAIGVTSVQTVNPLDYVSAVEAAKIAADTPGVSAIIYESPCIAVAKPAPRSYVDQEKCIGCKKCIKELGCPAIILDNKKVKIEPALCYGCSLCEYICPVDAIKGGTCS